MTRPQPPSVTGVTGLDTILGGGITPRSLVFIVGTPGAGKTILGSQIVFQAVQRGAKALILTAFSEGHVKLIEHLRPLAFFDESQIGNSLTFFSLPSLIGENPDAAAETLAQTIRRSGARVVLIDGFQGIVDIFKDIQAVRQMLATLSTLLTYLDVTLFVTLEGSGRDPALANHLTTADVLLDLTYAVDGQRNTRHIEVIKQRGQAHHPGLHPYTISAQGIMVFPRLESRLLPPARPRPTGRATFGLPELDALLGGGLNMGTITLLAGAHGVGKTTLALYWALAAAEPEHRTVFFTFGEYEAELSEKARTFGLDLGPALASGALAFIHLSPSEIEPDMVAAHLLAALTPTTARLVIDDSAALVQALGARAQDYLGALATHLYSAGVTSLFVVGIDLFAGHGFYVTPTPLTLVAQNVVVMHHVAIDGVLHRLLGVLKMRLSAHAQTLHEVVLAEGSVRVLGRTEMTPSVRQATTAISGGSSTP